MPHDHIIVDDDRRFIIDSETRAITNVSGNKPLLMQRDHKSERFTFEMPRVIEGHDVLECDLIEIHYENTSKGTSVSKRLVSADKYRIKDLMIDPNDDSRAIFTWLVERTATLHAGTLDFQIKFICYEDAEHEVEDFVWQTDKYLGAEIRAGLDANKTITDTYPSALEELDSRVIQLERRITTLEEEGIDTDNLVYVGNDEMPKNSVLQIVLDDDAGEDVEQTE